MSTRSRFEKLQQLLNSVDSLPLYQNNPLFRNLVQNVQEEFKDELNGDAIVVSWHIDDIHCRNDENDDCDGYKQLTNEEARDILHEIERKHDADIGINWTVIDTYLDDIG